MRVEVCDGCRKVNERAPSNAPEEYGGDGVVHVVASAALIVACWSLAALGLFLGFSGLAALRGRAEAVPFAPAAARAHGWQRSAVVVMEISLTLVGAAMALGGVYLAFSTIY